MCILGYNFRRSKEALEKSVLDVAMTISTHIVSTYSCNSKFEIII